MVASKLLNFKIKSKLRHRLWISQGIKLAAITYSDELTTEVLTAPFNNMQTLKWKARPTNAFFTTVDQTFGGSSQLPTTAESEVMKSLAKK